MPFGDIVFVPFPFTDLTTNRKRPGVVLAEIAYYSDVDIIIVMITKRHDNLGHFDVLLDHAHADFQQTGLKFKSAIRVHRIVTLSKSVVIRKLGQLGVRYGEELKASLRKLLGL